MVFSRKEVSAAQENFKFVSFEVKNISIWVRILCFWNFRLLFSLIYLKLQKGAPIVKTNPVTSVPQEFYGVGGRIRNQRLLATFKILKFKSPFWHLFKVKTVLTHNSHPPPNSHIYQVFTPFCPNENVTIDFFQHGVSYYSFFIIFENCAMQTWIWGFFTILGPLFRELIYPFEVKSFNYQNSHSHRKLTQ